jgi:hypothetical protein
MIKTTWNSVKMPLDGKVIINNPPINWPGYLCDPEHPLMTCNTYSRNNTKTDIEYAGTDSEEFFKQNLETMPDDWWYRHKKIKYEVNKSGYRTAEFDKIDWKNSVVLFGCSNVFGIGVAEDETISYYLENLLGRPVINLGSPGASNDLILYLNLLFFKNFGVPYAVGIMWSCTDRFRYFTENFYVDCGSWNAVPSDNSVCNDGVDMNQLWTLLNMNKYNELARTYFASLAVSSQWKDRCKLVSGSYFNWASYYARGDFTVNMNGGARDLLHPSKDCHLKSAEQFYGLLK